MGEKTVDKVQRIMKDPIQIRNICTSAHIDHGKTTFTDNLLSGAGMMSEHLAGKQLVMDFHEDEKERGITIDTAAVNMVHTFKGKEFLINMLDTPGHVDFGGDVTRAMRAVDGTIVLCDAVEGIMPQTETVLRQALREYVKPVLFINKVDRLIKELLLTPEQMQEKFVKIISDINNLIEEIAPKDFKQKWKVNVNDGSVAFGSAFHNWALSIPFMKANNVTFKDIIDGYQGGDEEKLKALAKKAPLHEVVLDMSIRHHPNPADAQKYRIPKLWHGDLESEEGKGLLACDSKGALFFVVTKITIDPQAGEIAAGRLFSGTVKKGLDVYLNRSKLTQKIQQVFIYYGSKREIVTEAQSGNIIGIGGIKSNVGETVTFNETEPFEKISHIFDPVITKAIEAKRPSDLPKLIEVMRQVAKEDPTIKIEINEETGEHLMHGMGELHLEVIENRVKTEKGVDIKTSDPIVVYRETISKESPEVEGKTPNKHNKFYFTVEPMNPKIAAAVKKGELPEIRIKKKDLTIRDTLVDCGMDSKTALKVKEFYNGNMLMDLTRGQVHLGEVFEMVYDMFEDVMDKGPLAREPCTNICVKLMDMKLHEDSIHRGPAQVYPALRDGIRGAMMHAKPTMFEPYQILHIEGPVDHVGDLSKLISNKRGQLLDMKQEGSLTIIKAKLPVGEMMGWSSALRSATGGRGNSSLIDQMFEKMPAELQEKVVRNIKSRKGLTEGQVGA